MDNLKFGTSIAVVVGGRKRAELFHKCLESIERNKVKNLQKIIINNGHEVEYIDSILNKIRYKRNPSHRNKLIQIYKNNKTQWEVVNLPVNLHSFFDLGDVWKISLNFALQITKYQTFQLISDDDYISKNYVTETLKIFSKYRNLSLIIPNISDYNFALNKITKLNIVNQDEQISNNELLRRLTSINPYGLSNPGGIFLANTRHLKNYLNYCSEPTPDVGFSIFLSPLGNIHLSSKMVFYKTTHSLQDHAVINNSDSSNIFYFTHMLRTLKLIDIHYNSIETTNNSLKLAKLYCKQIFIQNCILNISKFLKNRNQIINIFSNIIYLFIFQKVFVMTLIRLIIRKFNFQKK
jgi:hypothetical protein